jgi:hypothetical protein
MNTRVVQLDLFVKEKEQLEKLHKEKKEMSIDRRLSHLFGRMGSVDDELEEHRRQLEQVWQIITEIYMHKEKTL